MQMQLLLLIFVAHVWKLLVMLLLLGYFRGFILPSRSATEFVAAILFFVICLRVLLWLH